VSSATVTADFDIVKTNWKLIAGGGSSWPTSLKNAIDDNPNSFWLSQRDKVEYPFKMRLDLGSIEKISGFRYLPRQDDQSDSNIFSYSLRISRDGKSWVTVLNNKEFSNIGNNPVLQKVLFNKEYSTQYLELTVHHNISSTKTINIAEIGVITR